MYLCISVVAAIELKQKTQVSVEYKSTKAVTQQSKYKNLYEKKNRLHS